MRLAPMLFMLTAWVCVLGLTTWCFAKLLRADPKHEKMPPPGTSL
jgi:hypothetical protein